MVTLAGNQIALIMLTPLNILILDDQPARADQILIELRNGGFAPEWRLVGTEKGYLAELNSDLDIIFASYPPSQLNILNAINIMFNKALDIPFIVVSDVQGDEHTMQLMRQGITDYLVKERIAFVGQAVKDALEGKRLRQEKQDAEDQLVETNRQLDDAIHQLEKVRWQLVRQQRLSAFRQMSKEIVHYFNNALTPIIGYSDLALSRPEHMEDPVKIRTYFQRIQHSAKQAAQVVRLIQDFYLQRRATNLSELDINVIIEGVLDDLSDRVRNGEQPRTLNVDVQRDLGEIPPILGNKSDLEELFGALILNSLESTEQSGSVSVRTYARESSVVFELSDTGSGMSHEARQRCIEPFYTTRGRDHKGMGLSIAYSIIQRHEGTLEIESEEGKGSTFIISIPTDSQSASGVKDGADRTELKPLRVLIVDPQPLEQEVIANYLTDMDHYVDTASNAKEAFPKIATDNFDIVLTDMSIIEMDGGDIADIFKKLAPVYVVMMTDVATRLESTPKSLSSIDLTISKPVTRGSLRQAISQMMITGRATADA